MSTPTNPPLLADPPEFLRPDTASLARELAQDIRPVDDVVKDYGYTGAHDPLFQAVLTTNDFRRFLEEAMREWNNADSTKKRIRLKAQAAMEEGLPRLFETFNNAIDPKDRIDAGKLLAKLAGFEDQQNPNAMGGESGGVKIVINIGTRRVETNLPAQPKVIDPQGSPVLESAPV